jgi:hypothetical protein
LCFEGLGGDPTWRVLGWRPHLEGFWGGDPTLFRYESGDKERTRENKREEQQYMKEQILYEPININLVYIQIDEIVMLQF